MAENTFQRKAEFVQKLQKGITPPELRMHVEPHGYDPVLQIARADKMVHAVWDERLMVCFHVELVKRAYIDASAPNRFHRIDPSEKRVKALDQAFLHRETLMFESACRNIPYQC